MQYKYTYKFVHIAPRKIRLVTNLVKKMSPEKALLQLKYLQKDAAKPVYEILKSAIASCKIEGIDINDIKIASFTCDQGPALKRRRFKSRGRAHQIKKFLSHINLALETTEKNNVSKPKNDKKTIAKKLAKKDK